MKNTPSKRYSLCLPSYSDVYSKSYSFFDHTESIKQSDYSLTLLSFCHAGIDFATRKIASLLKPQKVIKQDGDSFTIRTLSTFRNYEVSFKIGEEFTEETKGLDNRSCQARGENIITTKFVSFKS